MLSVLNLAISIPTLRASANQTSFSASRCPCRDRRRDVGKHVAPCCSGRSAGQVAPSSWKGPSTCQYPKPPRRSMPVVRTCTTCNQKNRIPAKHLRTRGGTEPARCAAKFSSTSLFAPSLPSTRKTASGRFADIVGDRHPFQLFLTSSSAAYSSGSACCRERLHHVCSDTVPMRDVRHGKLEPNALVHDSVQ